MSFRRRRSVGIPWQSVGLIAGGAVLGAILLVLVLGGPGRDARTEQDQAPPGTTQASAADVGGTATLPPLAETASAEGQAIPSATPSPTTAVSSQAPTMPALPTPGAAPLPTATVPAREQIEASIRDAAERFQEAKEYSQRTGDTSQLPQALARDALERQTQLVDETKAAGCYWEISLDAPLQVEVLDLRDNEYARIRVQKTESRHKYCDGKLVSSVTGDAYSAGYVVELIDGKWFVTERE